MSKLLDLQYLQESLCFETKKKKNLFTVSHLTDGLILFEQQNESQSRQQKKTWVLSSFFIPPAFPPTNSGLVSLHEHLQHENIFGQKEGKKWIEIKWNGNASHIHINILRCFSWNHGGCRQTLDNVTEMSAATTSAEIMRYGRKKGHARAASCHR